MCSKKKRWVLIYLTSWPSTHFPLCHKPTTHYPDVLGFSPSSRMLSICPCRTVVYSSVAHAVCCTSQYKQRETPAKASPTTHRSPAQATQVMARREAGLSCVRCCVLFLDYPHHLSTSPFLASLPVSHRELGAMVWWLGRE